MVKFIFTKICSARLILSSGLLLRSLSVCCLLSLASVSAFSQHLITGIVASAQDNQELPGVTVKVVGTDRGTITDDEGRYSIEAETGDSLSFHYIGYVSKSIRVGTQRTINAALDPVSSELNSVVVVAFGKQKRSDMVGSVTSVNPEDLKVPSSNLTTALAGRVGGMIAYQRSGEPGLDNAEFFIRGVTTFGYKKDPLILVDGVEMNSTDLARLQVDDIASFSILKDATATAVYGSRAANGVILITTKEGTVGKAHLSFRFENSVSSPTKNLQLADPVTFMEAANEAVKTRDPLGVLLYSDRKIENTAAGDNPIVYPANDWRDIMFKDYTMNQRVNLSVSGGGGVARYYVSGSYNKDNGLMKVAKRNNFNNNIDLKSYMLRSNVNINLTKTTELTVRLSGTFDDYSGPIDGGTGMYNKVMHANPVLFPAYYPIDSQHIYVKHIMFGNFDQGQYINPYADMVKGYKQYSRSLMLAQLELKQDLAFVIPGLTFDAMVNTNRRSYFEVNRFYNPFWYTLDGYDKASDTYYLTNINPNTGTEYLGYTENGKDISTSFYLESRLNYSGTFKKNEVSGLLVFMAQQRLNANSGDLQQSLPFRNLGLSGRATYDFDKRYYVEFNFGYNGSERFDRDHRFGFFPSVGLAWSVSNEAFFKDVKKVVSNLRLRYTYGLIGNDAIGSPEDRFFYLSNVNMNDGGRSAGFGRDPGDQFRLNGISISRYSNADITWEVAKEQNFAVELGLFDKLNIDAEYFSQYRNNILMTRASIPLAAGFSAPIRANVGEASSKGIDMSLDYQQSFGPDFWLQGMANFTYATSEYEVYTEPHYAERWRSHVGHSIYQTYGYIAEKLFVDDAEAANSPLQNFGRYGGGDIKYLDVNRDGQITAADQVPIGNPTLPEIVYGFGLSAKYKSVDLSLFFQGLANESFWINTGAYDPVDNPGSTVPFDREGALLKAYADSYWSEDHRDVHALWPRLSPTYNENNTQVSTWFMRDGTFLRLKQVELGYTFANHLVEKIHLSHCRLYLNATNLFCFSPFRLWDAEMGGNGLGYPIQRVVNIGVDISIN